MKLYFFSLVFLSALAGTAQSFAAENPVNLSAQARIQTAKKIRKYIDFRLAHKNFNIEFQDIAELDGIKQVGLGASVLANLGFFLNHPTAKPQSYRITYKAYVFKEGPYNPEKLPDHAWDFNYDAITQELLTEARISIAGANQADRSFVVRISRSNYLEFLLYVLESRTSKSLNFDNKIEDMTAL